MTRNWKNEILSMYGVRAIERARDIPDQKAGAPYLWVSRCSKTKTGKDRALPREFYVSKWNRLFYAYMSRYGLRYGILSDRYGLHMDDERLDYYDIHPSQLTGEQKRRLGIIIGEKAKERGYEGLIFWYVSPVMSRPYFEMMSHSGLRCYYIASLKLLDRKYRKQG